MILIAALVLHWAPTRLVLWDGKPSTVGVGWVAGNSKRVSIERVASGKNTVIHFQAAEPKSYAECGWQWAPWTPEFAGTDFGPFSELDIELREFGPLLPGEIGLSLASPGDHRTTPRLPLAKVDPRYADGKWHRLRLPLKDLFTDVSKCDRSHVIQVILGAWNDTGGDFTVEIRRIEVRK